MRRHENPPTILINELLQTSPEFSSEWTLVTFNFPFPFCQLFNQVFFENRRHATSISTGLRHEIPREWRDTASREHASTRGILNPRPKLRTHSRNHANNSPIFQLSAVQFTFHRSFYTRKEGLVDTYRSCDRFQSSLLVNLYRSMRHTRNRSNQFFTRNLVLERNLSFSFLYILFTDAYILNFHDTRHCYDILLLLEYIFNVFVQVLTRQFLIKLHTKKYHFFPSHDLETTYAHNHLSLTRIFVHA